MLRLLPLVLLVVLALCLRKALAQQRPTTKTTKSAHVKRVGKPVVASKRKPTPVGKKGGKSELFPEPPAPVILPAQELPFERLTSREIWNNPRERRRAQASAERFIKFNGEKVDSTKYGPVWSYSKPALLYRKNQSDSVWTVIILVLPDYPTHETRGRLEWERDGFRWMDIVAVDTLNLDHQGEPEVLITMIMDCCGNSVHTEYAGVNLISIDETPKLLLTALTETADSGGYSEDDKPFEGGYVRRKVNLGADLIVGKIATNTLGWENLLTPLKSGSYKYREGHLVWVGQ